VFGSGFRPYQVELFTPSITWGRTNINLDGAVCGPNVEDAVTRSRHLATYRCGRNERPRDLRRLGGPITRGAFALRCNLKGNGARMTEFTPIPAIDGFVEALGTSITSWSPSGRLTIPSRIRYRSRRGGRPTELHYVLVLHAHGRDRGPHGRADHANCGAASGPYWIGFSFRRMSIFIKGLLNNLHIVSGSSI
jgi:hypothetical protein